MYGRERDAKKWGVPPARPGREDGILSVPGGLIHHWVGTAFIPRATLQRAVAVSSAYDAIVGIYKEVIASKLVAREGDVYRSDATEGIAGRCGRRAGYPFDGSVRPANSRSWLMSKLIKSARSRTPAKATSTCLPVGRDSGYLWRASSFTKFIEQDNGVYVEMETLGLSRSFPPFLGWFIEPIARRLGRKSIERSWKNTVTAVRKQDGVSP